MAVTITIPDSRDGRVVQFFGSADAMDVMQQAAGAVGYLSLWEVTLYFNAHAMEISPAT